MFSEPDESYHGLVYVDRFGREAYLARARAVYQRTTGAVLAPMSAFLLLQGIETVALRVERHVANAREVAEFLRARSRASPGSTMSASPTAAITRWPTNISAASAPSLLTFGVRGGLEAAKAFYDALKLVKRRGQHRRHPHAVLPSRLDHPSADDAGRSSCAPASRRRRSGSASASSMSRTSSPISIRRSASSPPALAALAAE